MTGSRIKNREDRYALGLAEELDSAMSAVSGINQIGRIEPYEDDEDARLSLDARPRSHFDAFFLDTGLDGAFEAWKKARDSTEGIYQTATDLQTRNISHRVLPTKIEKGRIDHIFFIFLDSIERPLKGLYGNGQTREPYTRAAHELFAANHIIRAILTYRNPRSVTSPLQVVFSDPAYTAQDCRQIKEFFKSVGPEANVVATHEFDWLRTISEYRPDSLNALVVSFNPTGPVRRLLSEIYRNLESELSKPYPKQPVVSILCPGSSEFDPVSTLTRQYLGNFRECKIILPEAVKDWAPFRELVWYLLKDKEFHFETDREGLVGS